MTCRPTGASSPRSIDAVIHEGEIKVACTGSLLLITLVEEEGEMANENTLAISKCLMVAMPSSVSSLVMAASVGWRAVGIGVLLSERQRGIATEHMRDLVGDVLVPGAREYRRIEPSATTLL